MQWIFNIAVNSQWITWSDIWPWLGHKQISFTENRPGRDSCQGHAPSNLITSQKSYKRARSLYWRPSLLKSWLKKLIEINYLCDRIDDALLTSFQFNAIDSRRWCLCWSINFTRFMKGAFWWACPKSSFQNPLAAKALKVFGDHDFAENISLLALWYRSYRLYSKIRISKFGYFKFSIQSA